jgi:hypothetical protein
MNSRASATLSRSLLGAVFLSAGNAVAQEQDLDLRYRSEWFPSHFQERGYRHIGLKPPLPETRYGQLRLPPLPSIAEPDYALPLSAMVFSLSRSDMEGLGQLAGGCALSVLGSYALSEVFNTHSLTMVPLCGAAYLQNRYGGQYGIPALSHIAASSSRETNTIGHVGQILGEVALNYWLSRQITSQTSNDRNFSIVLSSSGNVHLPMPDMPLARVPLAGGASGSGKSRFDLELKREPEGRIRFGVQMRWEW